MKQIIEGKQLITFLDAIKLASAKEKIIEQIIIKDGIVIINFKKKDK